MKKLPVMFCVILGIILFSNTVWCDFYVVAAGKRAKKTILVSPKSSAGSSGNALINALNNITDASATNPYLILIEPGKYDIGSNTLQMKPYVNIQGSGENITIIIGDKSSANPDSGVLQGADNMQLSSLTVDNYCYQGNHVIAIYNNNCSPVMDHVSAKASAHDGNYCYGVYNNDASPTMTNMTIKASTGSNYNEGIHNEDSAAILKNVSASATGGSNCRGIYNNEGSSDVMMTNVTAKATNGTDNRGVFSEHAGATMFNVTAIASGGTKSYGILLISSGSIAWRRADIENSYAEASGASFENMGIRITLSSIGIEGTTAYGGGASGRGISIHNASKVRINHSNIYGGQYSVYTTEEADRTDIGNTWLRGPTGGVGDCKCAGVYDSSYTFYPSTCP